MNRKKLYWGSIGLLGITLVMFALQLGVLQVYGQENSPGSSRDAIYAEMEAALGLVPSFFKSIPDATLELEWELMQRVQMEPGPIPNKYRELIGVAVSAATKCQYCTFFHTEFARLNGASEEEIEDALHYTKSTTGWSTYLNGSQIDMDLFQAEVRAMVEYLNQQAATNGANEVR